MSAKDVIGLVVIPLILAELLPWYGWFASKLLPRAALLRYGRGDRAVTRIEEWSGDLGNIPGQLSKLAYALGQLAVGSAVCAWRKVEDAGLARQPRRAIDRVPYAILWFAARRLRPDLRKDYEEEWRAELQFLLSRDGRALTDCLRGTAFSTELALATRKLGLDHNDKRPPPTGLTSLV